ncbi:pyocin knob domain-containing protein [Rhizobium sp. YS-1r]|uniref:pyocin knob domain-containing protein n=1 Tax=Rhizobium sp. YS-1r TaxID=1532558 RepID=UPI00068B0262|nr:pyocin knob domain-containing protein [Rhizobium sp. YS-1r]
MALLSDYTAGTVTVAAGGTAVTGVGTAWLTAGFQEGDEFFAAGWHGIVQSVNSNTSLTLYPTGIRGAALAGSAYRLRYQGDGSRLTAQARQLIELLGGNGNIQALSGLAGAANTFPIFTGAGTMDLATLTAFFRGLMDATDGPNLYGQMGPIPEAQLPTRLSAVDASSTLDSITETGFYLIGVAASVGPVPGQRVLVMHQRYSSSVAIQTAWIWSSRPRQFYRYYNNGAWSVWQTVGAEIVGQAQQVGGVSTGAIFERSSNANGEYVRFADGTQICTTLVTIKAEGDATTGIKSVSWTYPAAFNVIPGVHMSVITNNPTLRGKSTVSNNASLANLYYQEDSTTSAAVTARATAIGRWF